MIELNPLDGLKARELRTMPPHFSKIKVSNNERSARSLKDWIRAKLKGRFSIVPYPSLDSEGKLHTQTFVGFEEEKELTYFVLACPYLRRN